MDDPSFTISFYEGRWLASGPGILRPIVAEGGTQAEAMRHYSEMCVTQYEEQEAYTAKSIEAEEALK